MPPEDLKQEGDEEIEDLKKQLLSILVEEVASDSIDEQDMLILSLRLGLKSEKPYTLAETSRALHLPQERVRQRQYSLLRKRIKNPLFFKLLKTYALKRRLPPGFELHNIRNL